jgi:hypothetical protein
LPQRCLNVRFQAFGVNIVALQRQVSIVGREESFLDPDLFHGRISLESHGIR